MLGVGHNIVTPIKPIYKFVNKYSIDFDGTDDRIITDGADTVLQPTTYSFWCKSSTSSFNPVFGHGNYNIGSFSFNYDSTRPRLYLENNNFRYWDATSKQDDGEWHHWVVYLDADINNTKLYCDGVLQTVSSTTSSGTPTAYTESLTIGAYKVTGGGSFEGNIDEFAVYDRELTQAEITRMYNTYYSPNRVANGNFAQEGVEEVTNGDFSQIGSELVTNGDFATDTGWTKQTGWSIANGSASYDGSGTGYQYILQSITTTSGSIYKINFDVLSSTGSNLNIVDFGSVRVNQTHLSEGNYTYYAQADASSENLVIYANGTDTFSIDNVSVKEVGQGWTLVGDFEIDDTKAFITSASQYSQCTQQLGSTFLTSGKSYKLEADITTSITNALAYRVTGGAIVPIATSDIVGGKYTAYFTMTQDGYFWFQTTGSYTGLNATIDNVSVKEVGQHWTFGTGWSTDGTKALSDGSSGNLDASITALAGKTYKVTYTILDYVSGDTRFRFTGTSNENGTLRSANGTYVETITLTNSQSIFRMIGSGVYSIDNIVVQELKHDATNLMLNAGDYQSANPLITSTKSMEFDGVDDYMEVQDDSSLQLEGSAASWTFWTRLDSLSGGDQKFFAKSISGSDTNAYQLRTDNADLKFQFFSGAWRTATSSSFFTDLNWVNVTVTIDASNIVRIYKNGVETHNSNIGYSIPANTGEMLFGARTPSSPTNFLNGEMTEVGIYNRCLTALEVASLYNQGVPTDLLVSRGDYVATGLQGYWKMGDGTNDEYPIIYDQVDPTLGSDLTSPVDFLNWLQSSVDSRTSNTFTVSGSGRGVYFLLPENKTSKINVSGLTGSAEIRYRTTTGGAGTVLGASDTDLYVTTTNATSNIYLRATAAGTVSVTDVSIKELQGNPATMTNMVEGNITNQYPLTKIRNYYRMGDGILDGYPIIQDQTSPNLAHIPTTNLATYSENFTTLGWTNDQVTVTTNSVISPDGTQNASTITPTTSSSVHLISTTGTNTVAMSVYAKQNGYTRFRFNSGSSSNGYASFNLSTGEVAATGGTYLFDSGIEDVGNGWFRCFLVLRGGVATNMTIAIEDASGSVSFTGDGTSGIHLWAAQSEEQLQPTTYIKSDGIAAVRKSSTTNLIPYSEDFSAYTVSGNLTFGNNVTSPIGTTNASTINLTTGSSFIYENVNVTQSTVYTFSFYVKKGTLNDINFKLAIYDDSNNSFISVDIPYSTSTDWTRVEHTFTTPSGCTDIRAYIFRNTSSQEGDFYVWGTQVEEQTQAETYAKTTGLPVTISLFTENNYGTMTNMSASDIVEDTP